MKLSWIVIVVLLSIYVYVCRLREGFVSTGVQMSSTTNVTTTIAAINKLNAKHIVVIPYFIGINTLNVFVQQVNKLDSSFDNIYIIVVDTENQSITSKANELFTSLCSTVVDLQNQTAIVLTKNTTPKYPYSESTDIVFTNKINKLLSQLNNLS